MMEPTPPRAGEPLRASWAQRLVAYVRSLRVTAGPGLLARRTPSGTVVSLAPAASLRRDRPPMPFDCRIAETDNNGDAETHLFCYVPQSSGWICWGCNGAVQPAVTAIAGQTLSGDWLDCGEISSGDSAWLFFTVSASDYAKYGHATPLYETTQAHVGIGSPSYSVPSGRSDAYVLFPPVRIATWDSSAGLRQTFHGIYDAEAAFGDAALTGSGWGGTGGVRSLSVASTDYNGKPGVLSLHGFRSPSTISNPYRPSGTAPSSPDNILVLVRVLSSDGKTAELKYIRLADLAASSGGDGAPYGPGDTVYDTIEDLLEKPCPAEHGLELPLVYYWNPCDLEDAQGNVLQPAGWPRGQFWVTGGDEKTCNGSYVGDSSGNKAIYLDGHRLTGPNGNKAWAADGDFTVDGDIITPNTVHTDTIDATSSVQCGGTISATGNIGTPANISCGGTLTIGTGANAIDVGATLSGLDTLLSQI